VAWRPVVVVLKVSCLLLILSLSALPQHSSSPVGIPLTRSPAPADDQTPEVPGFHTESRQVIVEAEVWNHVDKKHPGDASWILPTWGLSLPDYAAPALKTLEGLHLPPPARGPTAKDFHILDNGVEQKINYFKEADFSAVGTLTPQWRLDPTTRGTWGIPFLQFRGVPYAPSATYMIGYAPPALRPDECRPIQIVVANHYVHVNREQYCALKDSDMATEETKLAARMQNFANSTAHGKIVVFVGAFAFWSSGVLTLARESPQSAPALPSGDFTYVVEVHDSKAPASVQVATQILLPNQLWKSPCPKNAAIHVRGMVYKTNGELAGRFGDTFRCGIKNDDPIAQQIAKLPGHLYLIPSLFDTEIELRPGHYEVRVVVSDGKNFGRAQAAFSVEPLDAHALTLSDVSVNSILRDASLIVRDATSVSPAPLVPTPLVSKSIVPSPIPGTPPITEDVEFLPFPYGQVWKGSPLSVYFEIYEPLPETANTAIYYRMRITNLKSGATVMNTEPISAAEFVAPGNSVVPIGLKLETNKLMPSLYRLEVQASDTAGRESEWRAAIFSIN
jgi:hypothetical protein